MYPDLIGVTQTDLWNQTGHRVPGNKVTHIPSQSLETGEMCLHLTRFQILSGDSKVFPVLLYNQNFVLKLKPCTRPECLRRLYL